MHVYLRNAEKSSHAPLRKEARRQRRLRERLLSLERVAALQAREVPTLVRVSGREVDAAKEALSNRHAGLREHHEDTREQVPEGLSEETMSGKTETRALQDVANALNSTGTLTVRDLCTIPCAMRIRVTRNLVKSTGEALRSIKNKSDRLDEKLRVQLIVNAPEGRIADSAKARERLLFGKNVLEDRLRRARIMKNWAERSCRRKP
jgi:hypothetical protein